MVGVRRFYVIPAIAAILVSGAACSGASAPHIPAGKISVVAAENFWGDLASQIGGSHVVVTSLINSPDADPHLFTPGTSNGLAVAQAAVVLVNGASYDPFMSKLLDAAPSSTRKVVNVADVLHVTGSDANPHLWYDTPRLPVVVHAIAGSLAAADPANAASYRRGAASTIKRLQPLEAAVQQLKASHSGAPVAYTERVPGYLLVAAGLNVLTPPGFAKSIEDGVDPSFSDIAAMHTLITDHRIKVLLYNEQAVSAITKQLQSLAADNGVAVVPVTETMPPTENFESWQLGQVQALAAALSS
jgi:zinc/manganese transport system substrate-binding protein